MSDPTVKSLRQINDLYSQDPAIPMIRHPFETLAEAIVEARDGRLESAQGDGDEQDADDDRTERESALAFIREVLKDALAYIPPTRAEAKRIKWLLKEGKMKRYWASWWSGYYADEGCTKPPFQTWTSGTAGRPGNTDRTNLAICAVIDAPNEAAIWETVMRHFPDAQQRFCEERALDFKPGDRFPGFEGKTNLT